MRGYGLTYREVLRTPLAAFWMLNRNLDRLRAEEDLRELQVGIVSQAKDAKLVENFDRQLRFEMGRIQVEKPKLDRKGLQGLKSLGMG